MSGDIQRILEGAGLKAEAFDRIKMGRGVVGKSTYVALAAVLALATISMRSSDTLLLFVCLGAIVAVFLSYFVGVIWFATKNPGTSLLEGAELIQWRQMDMGIKDTSIPLSAPNIGPEQQIGER